MSRFAQLHLLTSYPPSNLNRDDLGRPKTAVMGGELRLRVSSQSLKRAWRTSDFFKAEDLKLPIGKRTKKLGHKIFEDLKEKGVDTDKAKKWAKLTVEKFGKLKKGGTVENSDSQTNNSSKIKKSPKAKPDPKNSLQDLEIEQLAHFSQEELKNIEKLCSKISKENKDPSKKELDSLLQKDHKTADIAMFGRMLASHPKYNTEAAVQVAHALTVHSVTVEDDFFTAVDDLNTGEEDSGSAHLGVTEFSAGLFYLYLCIDKSSLIKNLCDDKALADKSLSALIKSAAMTAPTGKQNSFASRARASYIRCEVGGQQPRSLSVAFLKPISQGDMLPFAIKELEKTAENMNKVYGKCFENSKSMNAVTGEGSLDEIIECAVQ